MKKIIIIGASSGIGKEMALRLAEAGNLVGITARRKELLEEIEAFFPENIIACPLDVTSDNTLEKLEKLIATLGGMDRLIYCSGAGYPNPELAWEPEAATNRVNIDGFTRIAGYAYNYFKTRGHGHLAVITSVMGLRGSGLAPAYAASKAYQINYLEGLRQKSTKESGPIFVTELRPGSVNTDMMKGEGHFWIATPGQAAEVCLRAIAKKRRIAYITPRWRWIGILLKSLPGWIHRKM